MRWIRFALLTILLALLQAGIFAHWRIRPDLLLILLVFFAVYSNTYDAIITSFAIGFAADIIAPAMGSHTIAFGLFGTLLAHLHRIIAVRKLLYQATVIFAIGLFSALLINLLMLLRATPPKPDLLNELLWTPLYSSVAGPFLFLPFAWWMHIKSKRFSKS